MCVQVRGSGGWGVCALIYMLRLFFRATCKAVECGGKRSEGQGKKCVALFECQFVYAYKFIAGVSKPSARTPKQKSAKNTKSTKQLAADEAESEAENHPARPRPKPKPRKKPEKTKPLPEPSERDEHGTDDIVPASSKANSKAKGKATPKSKPSKATTSKHPGNPTSLIIIITYRPLSTQ